ncbi:MAG: serine hydrolase domain-containing protein [Gemmatimonadota bacterium]
MSIRTQGKPSAVSRGTELPSFGMTCMLTRALLLVTMAGLAAATPAMAEGTRAGEVRPELVGFSAEALARVDAAIEAAIRDGATPGAALAIGRRGGIVRRRGYGRLTYAADAPAVTDSTIFDLASLTKIVGTTSAIMKLVDDGRLDLDVPIYQYMRAWPSAGAHSRITLRHLLTHTSGLPAGADLWTTTGREATLSRIARMRLSAPPGMLTVYSDLGMIVAGAIVESVTGKRLDDFLERQVFAPMELRETMFNPAERMIDVRHSLAPIVVSAVARSLFFSPLAIIADWTEQQEIESRMFARSKPLPRGRIFDLSQVAPTEYSRARGEALRGIVHDRNAAALDGVAGHAGLFSSARDLAVFAQSILDAAIHDVDAPFASASTIARFVMNGDDKGRSLGWDTPSGRSSAGRYFPASSFGHTGFTGTSIWIDPKREIFVVLLTNRVHPTAANRKHIALRRGVHDAVELAVADEVVLARAEAE